MATGTINLRKKFELFEDQWRPKVVAEMNDIQFKVARVEGDFVWHEHDDTDEAFLVVDGTLHIDLPDGTVTLGEGELFVVPRGVRHRPWAESEAKIVLIEPRGVVNTGDDNDERRAPNDVWV